MLSFILLSIFILGWLFIRRKESSWTYKIVGIFFLVYLFLALGEIIGFPTFSQWKMMVENSGSIFSPKLELSFFSHLKDRSNFLNIIFFLPVGLFLPILWTRFKKFLPTVFYGFLFSLFIECSQLFTLYRVSDVNDLVMNTLGTIGGWVIWKIIFSHFFKQTAEENQDFIIFPFIIAFICFI